jgi:hypothetical protein
MTDAFLYSRISTKIPLAGKGVARQDAALTTFLRHHPDLVLRGTFRDLGISSFRGEHKLEDEFGELMKLVRSGKIKPGTMIICQSLDRIAGKGIHDVLATFLELIGAGIALATVNDDRVYQKAEDAGRNLVDMVTSIMIMSCAAEESEAQSKRGKKVWAAKRLAAAEHLVPMSKMTPAWLKLIDGKIVEIAERSAIIRRIFELCAAGHGHAAVVQKLNSDDQKCFGVSGRWSTSYIRQILSNRAVLGEFHPSECNHETDDRQVRVGETIADFYPRVVSAELWERAQAAVTIRSLVTRNLKVRDGRISNLFGGLCRCAECGGVMVMVAHSRNKSIHYLRCSNRYLRKTCPTGRMYSYEPLESAILDNLGSLLGDDEPQPDGAPLRRNEIIATTMEELRGAEKGHRRPSAHAPSDEDARILLPDISERRGQIADLTARVEDLEKTRSVALMMMAPDNTALDVIGDLIFKARADDLDARTKLAMLLRMVINGIGFFADGSAGVIARNGRRFVGIREGRIIWRPKMTDLDALIRERVGCLRALFPAVM